MDDIVLWTAGGAQAAARASVKAFRVVAQALGKVQAVVNIKKTVFATNSRRPRKLCSG